MIPRLDSPLNIGAFVVWMSLAVSATGPVHAQTEASDETAPNAKTEAEAVADTGADAVAVTDASDGTDAQSDASTDQSGVEDELTLEEKVDILTQEVSRLREEMNIPETDKQLESMYGMGPAASKVYGVAQGISLGGYGEFYFGAPITSTEETGATRVTDFYRFIAYFGYKFNDWIVMNTEIEFEHATTSANWQGKSGSVSVEFAYLDFLIGSGFNVRGGNLLVPMGFINQIHEPTTYWGNFRPEVERTIIPTTWREMGMGAHGRISSWQYSAYVLNGLNGVKFDTRGIRDARQKGNRAIWEDVGGVFALDYFHANAVRIGGSFYAGGADQDLVDFKVSNTILDLHLEVIYKGFKTRMLYASGHIDGSKDLTELHYPDTTPPADPETRAVPESQNGWYFEAGYDFAPMLVKGAGFTLTPWFRYENLNLQHRIDPETGRGPDPDLDGTLLTIGVESKVHPQVVLKLDWVHPTTEGDAATSDLIRFGAGFVY